MRKPQNQSKSPPQSLSKTIAVFVVLSHFCGFVEIKKIIECWRVQNNHQWQRFGDMQQNSAKLQPKLGAFAVVPRRISCHSRASHIISICDFLLPNSVRASRARHFHNIDRDNDRKTQTLQHRVRKRKR